MAGEDANPAEAGGAGAPFVSRGPPPRGQAGRPLVGAAAPVTGW